MTIGSALAPSAPADRARFGVRVDTPARSIVLCGELDAATAAVLNDAVLPTMVTLGRGDIELDITDVTFVCAAGLGALARLHARQSRSGYRLMIIGAQPAVRRAFDAGGMASLLDPDAMP